MHGKLNFCDDSYPNLSISTQIDDVWTAFVVPFVRFFTRLLSVIHQSTSEASHHVYKLNLRQSCHQWFHVSRYTWQYSMLHCALGLPLHRMESESCASFKLPPLIDIPTPRSHLGFTLNGNLLEIVLLLSLAKLTPVSTGRRMCM